MDAGDGRALGLACVKPWLQLYMGERQIDRQTDKKRRRWRRMKKRKRKEEEAKEKEKKEKEEKGKERRSKCFLETYVSFLLL